MIRPAQEGDALQLAELMTQLGYPTSAEEMAGRMQTISRDETFATFVAAEGNEVLRNDRPVRLSQLRAQRSQRQDHRARGAARMCAGAELGRELIQFRRRLSRAEEGRSASFSQSRFTREDAHKFYESLGYGGLDCAL